MVPRFQVNYRLPSLPKHNMHDSEKMTNPNKFYRLPFSLSHGETKAPPKTQLLSKESVSKGRKT